MRDWRYIDQYVTSLYGDIYEQPPDAGHIGMMRVVLQNWLPLLTTCHSVLDIGSGGVAIAKPFFEKFGIEYTGVALGPDAITAKEKGVYNMDMSFLEFPERSFDLVFARHVLEHSFSPLISLMEWYRVSKNWLCVILPNPDHFGWKGRNHYSMLHPDQAEFLLDRAGWNILWTDFEEPQELRYMCEKKRDSLYKQYTTGDMNEKKNHI